ncbi:zinc-binding dehydrogenase [Litoribacter ruber]|uniref:Zinc-binding dehydrogenase n=1 Tax=Litoribacter ruber TaxID=702568 RepID=A0AAP2G1S1_9BACT|nr:MULTISPECIES: zinc-binding dehydrogenase [Litoribacter]MBS9525079.1 zinc-binding dehydrogenase [Litoribacter alkaliphilus]MBT0811776.1 zinc-binding dehydrogenase [Litoribacter ruber]
MKGLILNDKNPSKIEVREVELPELKDDEVLVEVKAAALNHRDQWCREGRYPNIRNGVVLGSDGAGVVSKVGKNVDSKWLETEVVINSAMNWGEDQKAQSKDFEILGMPSHGTFAQYVIVKADRLHEKPEHFNWEQAGALPLGGLTAYRAVFFHGKVEKGQKVLVTGFGGGVAQYAAQFAIAAGGEVYVSSGHDQKIEVAKKQGAKGGFNYKEEAWTEQAKKETGGFDLVIDSAVGDTWGKLLKVMNPGAKLVFYGATLGNPKELDMRRVFWNQLTIQGSTMGSDADFKEMLAFVQEKQILPVIDKVYKLEEAVEAFDRMKAGDQIGKIVISMD